MSAYDAVIFDNDGILVDPPAHERQVAAARDAFRSLDIDGVERDDVTAIAGGVTHDRLMDVARVHDVDPTELWAARDRLDQRFQRADLTSGARTTYADVRAIGDCPAARGVVSNNHHAIVEFVLDHFDIDHLFDTYYGRERSVEALKLKKPNPHYIEQARRDLDAQFPVYVGDRPSDVRAANRAGVDSVFVRRPHARDVDLGVTPTHEIESLTELPPLVSNGRQ